MEYNCFTVLVSAERWSESAICIHISPPSCTFLPPTPPLSHPSRSSPSTKLSHLHFLLGNEPQNVTWYNFSTGHTASYKVRKFGFEPCSTWIQKGTLFSQVYYAPTKVKKENSVFFLAFALSDGNKFPQAQGWLHTGNGSSTQSLWPGLHLPSSKERTFKISFCFFFFKQ